MDDKTKLTENIAKCIAMQHEIVLDCIAHPEKYEPKPGPYIDAYGNLGYLYPETIERNGDDWWIA